MKMDNPLLTFWTARSKMAFLVAREAAQARQGDCAEEGGLARLGGVLACVVSP